MNILLFSMGAYTFQHVVNQSFSLADGTYSALNSRRHVTLSLFLPDEKEKSYLLSKYN
jgi:hypothetical protein